ncbi:MAG: bestrophin family ion channel [Saprospiraceae bacterium]|nr:bestrophin family ion channel [Saprospiraceae bacterium]
MIAHDPQKWVLAPTHFDRSDTIRKLFPWILLLCAYSGGIAWLELSYWKLSEQSQVRNLTIMHTLLGFVISFLLVFRTNTAYERWWEGRKLWGNLVNSSRNLAMKLASMLPEEDPHRNYFQKLIPAYAMALKDHLRAEKTRIELFEDLPAHVQQSLDLEKHVPNQLALAMLQLANQLATEEQITGFQFLSLNNELQAFTDVCGACERIKNTPIPYSYSVFIKKFILIYVATLPFSLVFTLGYLVIPVVAFVFYVLASLELIAEEIEEPFGGDDNDLPLGKIARNIEVHIHEII